ncbi:MAG TPA: thiamine pyrophosphate-binding protein [Aeromicrobium sp.]|nr:thiamine pyrophosphate-binding protein [Aeromicrobium sp.]
MSASAVALHLVNRLLALGATDVVVAPGSRSGPLARAAAAADAQGLLRLHVRVDEREAAFLALGLAKVSGRVTPVVTTSGTAVANLHPALLEALHSDAPLLAVTADRPARLRGTGANQTTVQPGIFPGIPFVDAIDELPTGGPAHLNVELAEPLTEPVDWQFEAVPTDAPEAHRESVVLASGPRTVVLAGDRSSRKARQVAEAGNWPLIAEPSSGSRTGPALTSGRLLLGRADLADRVERVISFGHSTLGRATTALLARDIEIVHVGDRSTFPVPRGPRVSFVDEVEVADAGDPAWLAEWRAADEAATAAVEAVIEVAGPEADPLRVAASVWAAIPPGGLLVVGSSNPIRDVDLVAVPFPVGERRKVIANRGLAGIDGVLSTAIGAALGRRSSTALAYVGDLTFLHGSNGLLIGPAEPRPDLTVVVANDDGGSIFATLEQGAPEFADSFERVFATPTGANIGGLCAAFGIAHERVDAAALPDVLAKTAAGVRVVEVPVPRDARRQLSSAIADACALRPM